MSEENKIPRICWTCKHFTYTFADDGKGWCTFGPPIRDVQEDATLASVTCHPIVMHVTYCSHWETDEKTLEGVREEEAQWKLRDAQWVLAQAEEKIQKIRAEADMRGMAEGDVKRQIERWEWEIAEARKTVEQLSKIDSEGK